MYRQRANSILNHIITNIHTSGGRRGIRGGGDITDIMEVTAVEVTAVEVMEVEAMEVEAMEVEAMAVEAMAVAGAEDVEDLDRIGDQHRG